MNISNLTIGQKEALLESKAIEIKTNIMKTYKLNNSQDFFNGSSTSNETLSREWTQELINEELNELLNEDEKVKSGHLSYNFKKSEFSEDEVCNLLGLYGEIEGEENDFYQVGWSKYKSYWRPTDLEQRNGRGERHGGLNKLGGTK